MQEKSMNNTTDFLMEQLEEALEERQGSDRRKADDGADPISGSDRRKNDRRKMMQASGKH